MLSVADKASFTVFSASGGFVRRTGVYAVCIQSMETSHSLQAPDRLREEMCLPLVFHVVSIMFDVMKEEFHRTKEYCLVIACVTLQWFAMNMKLCLWHWHKLHSRFAVLQLNEHVNVGETEQTSEGAVCGIQYEMYESCHVST